MGGVNLGPTLLMTMYQQKGRGEPRCYISKDYVPAAMEGLT